MVEPRGAGCRGGLDDREQDDADPEEDGEDDPDRGVLAESCVGEDEVDARDPKNPGDRGSKEKDWERSCVEPEF